MEEALIALILNDAGAAALLGNRIGWGRIPQKETGRPFALLQRIDGTRDYHMQGPSGLVASRVQIDAYGDTYTTAKTAMRAVLTAVSGHRGGIIQGIFVSSERDLPAADAGEVTHLYRTSADIIIHHSEGA